MANGDYEAVMGVKDMWKKPLSPSKTRATFSAKILNYDCSTWNITHILLCYARYLQSQMYTFVSRPRGGAVMRLRGFPGQDELAAGAAPSEMAKQISLFAIWQKKACPEESG